MINEILDFFSCTVELPDELQKKVSQVHNALYDDPLKKDKDAGRKVYFSGFNHDGQPIAGVCVLNGCKVNYRLHRLTHIESPTDSSAFLIPMLNAKKIWEMIYGKSMKRILLNEMSLLGVCILLVANRDDRQEEIHIAADNPFNSRTFSRINMAKVKNGADGFKYDAAILTNVRKNQLGNLLDRMNVEGRCFIISPMVDRTVGLDTYKCIHHKRVELIGWNETVMEKITPSEENEIGTYWEELQRKVD